MKVGDYARTKWGIIGKISKIIDFEKKNKKPFLNYKNMLILTNDEGYDVIGSRGEIVKSSSNIIDLLKIGDIITFKDDCDVYRIASVPDKEVALDVFYLEKNYDGETEDICVEQDEMQEWINSIVTKEQFEEMEYKVGVDKE